MQPMYAIVEIAGQQFKVAPEQKHYVNRLPQAEGDTVEFDRVLMVNQESDVQVGTPVLEGVKVRAKVLRHLQGDKVTIFKKRRRKGYKLKRGHRQQLSQIQIEGIGA